MQEFLNGLSLKLKFIRREQHGQTLWIYCESELAAGQSVHSRVDRVIKDINFGDNKVELHILWKKFYNKGLQSPKTTVSEVFDFIEGRGRRTKRLDNLLMSMQKEMSVIGCERFIRESVADVSDTTILRMIYKKNRTSQQT